MIIACSQFGRIQILEWMPEHDSPGYRLEVIQHLGQGNPKADRQHLENPQAGLTAPVLQFRDVDSANS